MNKIGIFLAVGIWVLVIVVIGGSYIFGEKEDLRDILKTLSGFSQQYVNDEDVDLSQIKKDGPSYDYLRVLATYFKEKQEIERKLNGETKELLAVLSVDSISNQAVLDTSVAKAEAYTALVQKSFEDLNASISKMNAALLKLEGETKIFNVQKAIKSSEKTIATAEEQAKIRMALAQYSKALIEFVKSRAGNYTVEEKRLAFKNPEDQAYFDQLYLQAYEINKKLQDALADERSKFRTEVGKIRF